MPKKNKIIPPGGRVDALLASIEGGTVLHYSRDIVNVKRAVLFAQCTYVCIKSLGNGTYKFENALFVYFDLK